MINSEFLNASAEHLARRVESIVGDAASLPKKIETAYSLALARRPSATESSLAEQHIQQLKVLYEKSGIASEESSQRSLQNFVHMLICSNEFLYID